jgi:hypothetical protein
MAVCLRLGRIPSGGYGLGRPSNTEHAGKRRVTPYDVVVNSGAGMSERQSPAAISQKRMQP